MEHKFKQLQNKLNALSQPIDSHYDHTHKIKVKTLQQAIARMQNRFEQENLIQDHKCNQMFDHLRKLEHALKEINNQVELEESALQAKTNKLDKTIKKILERLNKERKQADKKIQNSLQTYLIELTSFKGKAANSCSASIRELKQLEKDVDNLDRQAKRSVQMSKDIHKKIYSQFSTQIQQIGASLLVQERVRQQQEEQLLDTVQKSYSNLHQVIVSNRKQREKHERDIVELLEKVIEKIKHQLLHD